MGNYLFRVEYWINGKHNGIALIYAADEAEARVIHVQQRSNEILSVKAMTGGFTPGTFTGAIKRDYLPYEK